MRFTYQQISAKKPMKYCYLSMMVTMLMVQPAFAEANMQNLPSVTLDKIVVVADKGVPADIGEKVETAQTIKENLVQSNDDLVRYNPEVSVAEVGRYGSQGFAIRGVDGNRVALTLDGVQLPDVEVNQIYLPYGYMYVGRHAPDVELMSEISLQTGANSLESGSGALGGAVNYRTKDPLDLIKSNNQLGGYVKTGYTNKNEELMTAVGLAGKTDKIEAMVNYVYREGHELKNHQMKAHDKAKLDVNYNFPDNEEDRDSILPDPSHYESHATLLKGYYHVNDNHRLGLHANYQYRLNHINTISKNVIGRRIGYDEAELQSYGLNYRYQADNQWLDNINVDATYQETAGIGHSQVYSPNFATNLYEYTRTEYRPTYDTTKQIRFDSKSLPIDFDKWGSHQFALNAVYVDTKHEPLTLSYDYYKSSNSTILTRAYHTPRVNKNQFSLMLMDNIYLNEKTDMTAGIRYDKHVYEPFATAEDIAHANVSTDGASMLLKNGKFNKISKEHVTWQLGASYQLTDHWQTKYKIATGFLAPTITQLYSGFIGNGVQEVQNPDLNPETSLNHELEFQGNYTDFSVKLAGFYTDYQDFIDTYFYRDSSVSQNTLIKYININSAKTYGLRLGGVWDISNKVKTDGSLQLTGEFSLAKDSTSQGTNLLATHPPSGVIGLDYKSANFEYDIHAKLRYLGAKKASDAKVLNTDDNGNEYVGAYKHIGVSKDALVFDLYGTKYFNKGFSLSAGVYNVFDKKYIPWDNLRMMAVTNINNMVDNEGKGLERYTASGRNYALSLNYEF